MNEVKPVIIEKNGFKNLDLKQTFVKDNDFLILQKGNFEEGIERTAVSKFSKEDYTFYSCKALYDGDEISFLLYDVDHQGYKTISVDSMFKMTVKKEAYVDKKGIDKIKKYFIFEEL